MAKLGTVNNRLIARSGQLSCGCCSSWCDTLVYPTTIDLTAGYWTTTNPYGSGGFAWTENGIGWADFENPVPRTASTAILWTSNVQMPVRQSPWINITMAFSFSVIDGSQFTWNQFNSGVLSVVRFLLGTRTEPLNANAASPYFVQISRFSSATSLRAIIGPISGSSYFTTFTSGTTYTSVLTRQASGIATHTFNGVSTGSVPAGTFRDALCDLPVAILFYFPAVPSGGSISLRVNQFTLTVT